MEELQIKITSDIGWGFSFDDLQNQLAGQTFDKLKIPINTFGGSVLEGIPIYNTLLGLINSGKEVETHIIGYAMSMGTIIACGGSEVTMPENGWYMIHNPSMGAWGDYKEMEWAKELLGKMRDDLASIYKRKTGLSLTEIKSMMDKETWLTAKEAKAMGFVDRLTQGAQFEASLKPDVFQEFKNIPESIKANFSNNIINESKATKNMDLLKSVAAFFGRDFKNEAEATAHLEQTSITAMIEEKVSEKLDSSVDAKIATAVNDVKASNSVMDYEAMNDKVNDLESKLNAQSEKIESLGTLQEGINALNESVNALQENISTLTSEKEVVDETVADLEASKKEMEGKIEQAEAKAKLAQKEAADLKAKLNKGEEVTANATLEITGQSTKATEKLGKDFTTALFGKKN